MTTWWRSRMESFLSVQSNVEPSGEPVPRWWLIPGCLPPSDNRPLSPCLQSQAATNSASSSDTWESQLKSLQQKLDTVTVLLRSVDASMEKLFSSRCKSSARESISPCDASSTSLR